MCVEVPSNKVRNVGGWGRGGEDALEVGAEFGVIDLVVNVDESQDFSGDHDVEDHT